MACATPGGAHRDSQEAAPEEDCELRRWYWKVELRMLYPPLFGIGYSFDVVVEKKESGVRTEKPEMSSRG